MSTSHATTTYDLAAHRIHMERLHLELTSGLRQVILIEDLVGQADVETNTAFALLTRTYITTHRKMGLRAADLDMLIADRKRTLREAQAAANAAAGNTEPHMDTPIYRFVCEHLDREGVRVGANGGLQHPALTEMAVRDRLAVLASALETPFALRALDKTVDAVKFDRKRIAFEQARAVVSAAVDPDLANAAADSLVDMLALALDPHSRFAPGEVAALLLKVIYDTKRKLWNLPVAFHVMPILSGRQGGGKSGLVNALTAPLEELRVELSLSELTDERQIGIFGNFLGILDELDKADRASVESIKRIVSAETITRRIFHTQAAAEVRQCLTFIGTSNRDVAEAILDETGNRRFVQIDINPPDREAFWAALKQVDWLTIWRMVDHRGPDPSRDVDLSRRVAEAQAEDRVLSPIELWLRDRREAGRTPYRREDGDSGLAAGDATDGSTFVPTRLLYEDFAGWEETNAPSRRMPRVVFEKALARMAKQGLLEGIAKSRSVTANGYLIAPHGATPDAPPPRRPTPRERIEAMKAAHRAKGGLV